MKTFALLTAATIGMLSTQAFAETFGVPGIVFRAKLDAKLKYTDASGKALQMGKVSAQLIQNGQRRALRVDGKDLPVTDSAFFFEDCFGWRGNGTSVWAKLPRQTVEALIESAIPTVRRLGSTERRVAEAAARILAESPDEAAITLHGHACDRPLETDNTLDWDYLFVSKKTGERIKLSVSFDSLMRMEREQ